MKESIVLDLDGTLLDSKLRHSIVLMDVCRDYDIILNANFEFKDYINYKKNGKNTLQYLMEIHQLDNEAAQKIAKSWIDKIEDEQYLLLDTLFFDTPFILSKLSTSFDLVLLTARKNKENLITQLKQKIIFDFFNEIHCVSPLSAKEEKRKVIARLENPVHCFIGDTEVDWYSAQKNNLIFIPLNRGFRDKSFWFEKSLLSYSSIVTIPQLKTYFYH